MTPPNNETPYKSTRSEAVMEYGFVAVAFAIFFFAMISTLTKSGHDAANEGDAHSHSEAPAASHH